MTFSKTIAITPGDPAGIGPEVVLKALESWSRPPETRIILVSSIDITRHGPSKIPWEHIASDEAIPSTASPFLLLTGSKPNETPVAPGNPSEPAARIALTDLNRAIDLALQNVAGTLVTGPVSKQTIQQVHPGFVGVTEHLGLRTQSRAPVMAFFADHLKVALVTTHLPLKKVPAVLTAERIAGTIRTVHETMVHYVNISKPRIAVCGLNPHAGENGMFGREEETFITPAIELARSNGIACSGPYPADSLFRRAIRNEFDFVVAMYHDQGLGPVKTHSSMSVNVTLGLPFIRTSASHGTAFDIAGRGTADPDPMIHAIRLAVEMSRSRLNLF